MNIPGMREYNPCMPWGYKWDDICNSIATDALTFVDDALLTVKSKLHVAKATRRFASRVNYFGSQDAPRKRRKASQDDNGPWTGSIIVTHNENVYAKAPQVKWDKVKVIVLKWLAKLENENKESIRLDHNLLEQDRGFLVHLSMTYD